MIEFTCETCGRTFLRKQASHKNSSHHFCSQKCHYNYAQLGWHDIERQYGGIVKMGSDIGRKAHGQAYLWHTCIGCGKKRWVQLKQGKPSSMRCPKCSNNLPERRRKLWEKTWKGGRVKNTNGYVGVSLGDDSPYKSMVNATTYVMEHRLIVAQSLGRCLRNDEIVHHLNGIRDDNRLSNLLLMSSNKHNKIIPFMQKRIQELEALLKEQGQLI